MLLREALAGRRALQLHAARLSVALRPLGARRYAVVVECHGSRIWTKSPRILTTFTRWVSAR